MRETLKNQHFSHLIIMPQTGIEPSVKSAKPEKQEGSAHLLLSVSKSVLSTTPDDLKNKDLNSYAVPMNVHLPLYISRKLSFFLNFKSYATLNCISLC